MNRFIYLFAVLRPLLPILMILVGGIGAIYIIGTGIGGKVLLAVCLLTVLIGISTYASEETKKSEFFERYFGSGSKKKSRGRKRMGKRCPQCQKMIYHRRTVCQHCGYEFPSKKYKEEKSKKKRQESNNKAQA